MCKIGKELDLPKNPRTPLVLRLPIIRLSFSFHHINPSLNKKFDWLSGETERHWEKGPLIKKNQIHHMYTFQGPLINNIEQYHTRETLESVHKWTNQIHHKLMSRGPTRWLSMSIIRLLGFVLLSCLPLIWHSSVCESSADSICSGRWLDFNRQGISISSISIRSSFLRSRILGSTHWVR